MTVTRDATVEQPIHDSETMAQPYPPSWVDHVTDWVERLPGSSWLVYLGLWLALFLLLNAVKWLDGSQPLGAIEIRHAARAVHGVYFLALMHYLNRAAGAALRTFRPALAVSEAEYARLHYQLTTLPARGALLASVTGATLASLAVLFNPTPSDPEYATSLPMVVLESGFFIFAFTVLGALIYHTIHQFTTVSRIHATATRINLFQPDPLYAFSGLAARTVVGYILIVDSTFVFMRAEAADPATAGMLVFMVLLAIATFALPLLGMHRRMDEEKTRLEVEANQRLEAAIAELHRRMDAGDLTDMTELYRAMASLQIERDVLAKTPTWPWQPGTLRAVISALLFPVVVWLTQRFLDRFIGS